MSDNKPVIKLRDGRLKLAVWANETEEGKTFYSTKLTRSYKDKADEWQDGDSLNSDDLLPAAQLLQRAYTAILELKQAQ